MASRHLKRPLAPVQRHAYTRQEAAAALGMSIDHFERNVQPLLKVIYCGQLILVSPAEIDRWVRENERYNTPEIAA